ncbi:MAG: F0F1 ATP synthase subunit gamma, partial [bacterium]|nr:F0F1 ATP synthase subunit gamma [bacterium]
IDLSLSGAGDFGKLEEVKPISDFLIRSFLEDKFQKIWIIYTGFLSTFSLKPKKIQLLPLREEDLKDFLGEELKEITTDFLIEPSKEMLVEEITPQLVSYLIYQCVLENNASEHSARMLAMKNASDNAKGKSSELWLDYNKARQEQITLEVCEISSTKEVLE